MIKKSRAVRNRIIATTNDKLIDKHIRETSGGINFRIKNLDAILKHLEENPYDPEIRIS